MKTQLFLSMATFALVASISPGPVNIVSLASSIRYGFRATMRHVTGATFGFTGLLLLIGLGMYEVLERHPMLMGYLRWFGAAFLVYMALQLAKDSGALTPSTNQKAPSFWQGAMMQCLNPKAWLASAAGMGAYATNGNVSLVWQFSFIYFVICYVSLAVWAYAGSRLRVYLQNPRYLRLFNHLMAGLLLASAWYLLVSHE
jgi:threonine/homoserine/homoserine lactone efflux protein